SDDLNAIKFYYEVSGQHNPNAVQVMNLASILAQLMEILVGFLTPSELITVADKMETILNAQSKELNSAAVPRVASSEEKPGFTPENEVFDAILSEERPTGSEWDTAIGSEGLPESIRGFRLQNR